MKPPEPLLDTKTIAAELGIPENMIWKWKHAGHLMPGGIVRGRGRGGLVPLYRLSDVQPLAEAYLARRADTPDPRE